MPQRGTLVVLAVTLASLPLAGACVEGVTPDCSDAAAACGPGIDGAAQPDAGGSAPALDAASEQ